MSEGEARPGPAEVEAVLERCRSSCKELRRQLRVAKLILHLVSELAVEDPDRPVRPDLVRPLVKAIRKLLRKFRGKVKRELSELVRVPDNLALALAPRDLA